MAVRGCRSLERMCLLRQCGDVARSSRASALRPVTPRLCDPSPTSTFGLWCRLPMACHPCQDFLEPAAGIIRMYQNIWWCGAVQRMADGGISVAATFPMPMF